MKGIIFTEFIEHIEQELGLDVLDAVLSAGNFASGGSYTAVGDYDHRELIQLVAALSKATKIPASELLLGFSRYLFRIFVRRPETVQAGATNTFEMLEALDTTVHTTVRKLYPNASLPAFKCTREGDTMRVHYQSHRCMGAFACGMLRAAIEHYGDALEIEEIDLDGGKGGLVEFVLSPTYG